MSTPNTHDRRFKTEQDANDYKAKHGLHNRVAEPLSGGRWGLVFPIESHLTVISHVYDAQGANLNQAEPAEDDTDAPRPGRQRQQ